ncbi:hypothetical protein [Corynebacterium variabile]|uniref:hypothetical protein n=1 Tax=Corynebacterium variabile TaxID=1727 RepID=UPI0028E8C1F2|nr:hypothetical protein [Corynebacterium variabile]
MTEDDVQAAYSARAAEYAELLDSIDHAAAPDINLITEWARGISGPVCDVGCGAGQWTQLLTELARCVRPGGRLALGFFTNTTLEPFDHAVTTAWFWPVDQLQRRVEEAGFTVTHSETRTDPGARPHGAILATR